MNEVFVLLIVDDDCHEFFTSNKKDKLIDLIIDSIRHYHRNDVYISNYDLEDVISSMKDSISKFGWWKYEPSEIEYFISSTNLI